VRRQITDTLGRGDMCPAERKPGAATGVPRRATYRLDVPLVVEEVDEASEVHPNVQRAASGAFLVIQRPMEPTQLMLVPKGARLMVPRRGAELEPVRGAGRGRRAGRRTRQGVPRPAVLSRALGTRCGGTCAPRKRWRG
jgi:hypothetical protein